jgi:uracil-DNA glycosylase family 4
MQGDGPSNADLMIVGEAPGEQEDDLNRPFVGQAGEYLRDDLLVPAGIPESKVRFTNAVRCHPKQNKTPSAGAIRKCRQYLEAEIRRINPIVIVGMGNVPLASLLHFFYSKGVEDGASKKTEAKVGGITKWQGKTIWLQEFQCWFIPTFHPSYCMRNERGGSLYSTNKVIEDLSKAWGLANKPRPNYRMPIAEIVDSPEHALTVIDEMKENKVFAFDIETGGKGRAIDKYVLGASFCCSEDRGYYIRWKTLKDPKVYCEFISLVNNKLYTKVMHNGAYELRIFKFNDIPISDNYYDTMMAVHLLDENFYKGLKPNAWVMTRFGGYDVELEKYKSENKIVEDYSKIPDDMLTEYGAYDAIATWIIYNKTKKALKEETMLPLFNKIIMPVRRVLTNAEVTGMRVDIERANALKDASKRAMEALENCIYKEAGEEFNLNSTKQLSDVLYVRMKLPALKKTISGYSCDKESIEYIKNKTGHPIAGYLSDRNYIKTMFTTHISQAIEFAWPEDGRIHTNYNSTGTVTGRISCIAESTLVQTSRGKVPIEQVVPGDLVRSHTGEFRKVLQTLDQGVRPVYRLTTEKSRHILCTSDHRFLTPLGWVCAKNLEEVYCDRQSYAMHTHGAPEFTPEVESIASFTYVGEIQVYDLTVDVDASFIAEGFLVHNCSMPSLQNVPSDSLIRSLYTASPGNMLVEADLKSAEMAIIAAISGERTFIRSFEEGLDIHSETYRQIYDLPADYECTKLERRLAKCFHPDTEVLTPRGWVRMRDLRGEPIIQAVLGSIGEPVSLEWTSEYTCPLAPNEHDKLVHLKNEGIDLMVTPDHRMVVQKSGTSKEWSVVTPYEVEKSRGWVNAGVLTGGKVVNEDVLRLAVAIQADGSLNGDRVRFGFTKRRKKDRLCRLLDSLGAEYTVDWKYHWKTPMWYFMVSGDAVTSALNFLEDKCFSWGMLALDFDSRKVIVDESRFWDSHRACNRKQFIYSSNTKQNVDILQAIASSIGLKTRAVYNGRGMWLLSVKDHAKTQGGSLKLTEIPYTDSVALLSVPSTFVLVRYGGVPIITGQTINFGLIYGISASGLSARLGMSIEEAQEFIDLYFERLPNVSKWMDKQKRFVRAYGYVESPFHRKRHLPEALSDKPVDIGRAERQAMNSPIQSGAADYTYVGLIRLDRSIRNDRLDGRIVHSVHDCVVTDTPMAEIDQMSELVVSAFERPLKIVPIRMVAEVEVNKRWGQQNESKLQTILDSLKIEV